MTVWRRMWAGSGWNAVVRRSLCAGLLMLLGAITIAAHQAETAITQMTYAPYFSESDWVGSGAGMALGLRGQWLQTRGEVTGYNGPVWYVSYTEVSSPDYEEYEAERSFYSQTEAEAFAATRTGARIQAGWEYEEQADIEGQLLVEPDGSPMVEIVTSTDHVLYASPTVQQAQTETGRILRPDGMSVAPDGGGWATWIGLSEGIRLGDVRGAQLVMTCAMEQDAQWLPYGTGLLAGVDPFPPGTTYHVCGFRTTAMLARMRQVTWERYLGVGALTAGGIGVGTSVLVGGVGAIAERVRRRAVAAAAADLPEMVAGSGPMAGLTDGVNVSLARARSAVEQQRGFVADAAHELRSPLSSLITTLEVAERYPHLTDQRSVTAASLKQARRIERLTQDLLTLAQVDARAPVRQDSVALDDVIRDVADDHRGQGREIRVDAPAPATVVGDPEALRRVLANLVANAVRHARREVTVTLLTWPDRIDVTVADDGAGIAAVDRERIFDRFTRLDEARGRDAGGSGLGLSVARELARRHGGDVTLDPPSRAAAGAVFRVTLPTAR